MTAVAARAPSGIYLDDAGHHRVITPALAKHLFTGPYVTARDALRPMTPLIEPAATLYRQIMEGPSNPDQVSILSADGGYHDHLSGPAEAALARAYRTLPAAVEAAAEALADTWETDRLDTVDVARFMHLVPAQIATRVLFGIPRDPADVAAWTHAQTDLVFRYRVPGETDEDVAGWQTAGLRAGQSLAQAVGDTIGAHMAPGDTGDDVTGDLLGSGLASVEVFGLIFGVGIASIEGNGYSIGNAIHELLKRDRWNDLRRRDGWHAAYAMIMPLLQARPGIHSIYRTTTAAIPVGEHTIPEGATIAFDLRRIGDPFGGIRNPHRCIGANIGRLSVAVVPWILARRFPHARLAEATEPPLVPSRFFLGFSRLPVALR